METESLLVVAERLIDQARAQGFEFQRVADGVDGAVLGTRQCADWTDTIVLSTEGPGFSRVSAASAAASAAAVTRFGSAGPRCWRLGRHWSNYASPVTR